MKPNLAANLHNILAVARREFMFRGRTRTFRLTTVLLVVVGVALALAPVIIQFIDRGSTGERVEIYVGDSKPGVDAVTIVGAILNAPSAGTTTTPNAKPDYIIEPVTDLEAARAKVVDGGASAVLAMSRVASGDLSFTVYSKDSILSRRNQLLQVAAGQVAVQDRLVRAGLDLGQFQQLNAPPAFVLVPADPNGKIGPTSVQDFASSAAISFVLAILLFMAIILYGQWVAFSVAEEKNSRVMEVVLAAATPFQLMTGKVAGVGGLALVQYVLVLVPASVVLIFQGQIASRLLGAGGASVDLPAGLSIGMLVVFGIMFVLGFALYAVLYAGAASLVSRQEDVNQIVAPLTMISVAGYLVATYSGTGIIPIDSPLVVILSFVPFFSPYLMLTRLGQQAVGPVEVVVAILILAAFIPVALWVAARLYRSGVLLYGQRPTPRTLLRALRGS